VQRLDLDVPFAERDRVRRLGARWDVERRRWYAPADVDAAVLLGWSRASPFVNVRAHDFLLLESHYRCEHCEGLTRVHGIVLPPGHEIRLLGDGPGDEEWERSDEPTLLSFITSLAPAVCQRLRHVSVLYRLRSAFVGSVPYFYNHCDQCGGCLNEHGLFGTPGTGFDVLDGHAAAAIHVTAVRSGFAGCAEHFSYGVSFLEAMRHD
jgi:Domain of unknown function (DUF5710)